MNDELETQQQPTQVEFDELAALKAAGASAADL